VARSPTHLRYLSLVAAMRELLAGRLRLALVEIMDEMSALSRNEEEGGED